MFSEAPAPQPARPSGMSQRLKSCDFHLDSEVVGDILGRLTRFETVNTYPARMKKKDGSIAYVMINSNVYKDKWQNFEHTRCFTTSVDEKVWSALRQKSDLGGEE